MLADLKYALRKLAKSPGFAAVAVLTLALGIGACTAIFSVVNGVLLSPLGYTDADHLIVIRENQVPKFSDFAISPANFRDWEKQAKSFAALAAYTGLPLNLTGGQEPQRLMGVRATAHFFDVFGIKPILGRTFLPEEDAPGKNRVVVLSHAFWQHSLGGEPSIVGRMLQLNGEPYTVIGIAPPGFGPPSFGQPLKTDAWIPAALSAYELSDAMRGSHYVNTAVGRLAPGVTAAQADAELKTIAARLAAQYPDSNRGWSTAVMPMLDYSVRDVRGVLYTLLGAVACLLLIACTNVANLLLVRASARHREISIRAALGAGRARLLRQLLTESVVLSLLGGAAGVLLASWGLDAVISLAPPSLPRAEEIHLDGMVLAVSITLSIATGIFFGLAPAWLAARTNVNDALKQGARGSTDTRGRLRGSLVVAEIAVTLVLLIGAGLLVRSFAKLSHVDPGFIPENATVIRIPLPEKKYSTPAQQVAFADALLARLRALPTVEAVGLTHTFPLQGDWVEYLEIKDEPRVAPNDSPAVNYYGVTADYFRAMGTRVIQGRAFTEHDNATSPRVAIVNETFVRHHFPHTDPVGRRISVGVEDKTTWREIVGVVADVAQYGLDEPAPDQVYDPFAQHPVPFMVVVARLNARPAVFLQALRPAVQAIDRDQPVGTILPLESILAASVAKQRFAAQLLAIFSIIALILAVVGIYGVVAYNVTQRTGEIGIRLALGAQRSDVLTLVFRQAGRLVALGLVAGLAGSFLLTRFLASMLFGVSTCDPLTFVAIASLLATIAAVACFLPARRATKVDPMVALRAE